MMKNILLVQLKTIINRETARFLRIWSQTLLPPVINQTLYFIIVGGIIGSRLGETGSVPYMAFLTPGLIMMAVTNSAYSNTAFSFFSAKFQKSIEEMLVAPMPKWVIIFGYTAGAVLRGLLVGLIVFFISMIFVKPVVQNFGIVLVFILLTSMAFGLGGMINAVYSKKFDDVSFVPTFILTPLGYLGGVFYSVESLPDFWQKVSMFNPIVYMVDGFRFGFFGVSSVNVWLSFSVLVVINFIFLFWLGWLFKKGIGLKM